MKPIGPITKKTSVRDAEKLLTIPTMVVREDEALERIARLVADNPATKTVAVVDEGGRLVGVIPLGQVLDDVFLQIVPEEFLTEIVDFDTAARFARKSAVNQAKDLMLPPVWVKMDETVKDAFERMHKNRLNGLPIVDDESHVVGYLDMLELLLIWIKTKEE